MEESERALNLDERNMKKRTRNKSAKLSIVLPLFLAIILFVFQ